MYKVKYELSPPTLRTQLRMVEIKFFLMNKSILEISDFIQMNGFIEAIAKLFNLSVTELNIATNMLRRASGRPDRREMIIALRLMGMSYAKIRGLIGCDMRTITKYIKQYLEDEEPELLPRLQNKVHPSLIKYMTIFEKFMREPYEKLSLFEGTTIGEDM